MKRLSLCGQISGIAIFGLISGCFVLGLDRLCDLIVHVPDDAPVGKGFEFIKNRFSLSDESLSNRIYVLLIIVFFIGIVVFKAGGGMVWWAEQILKDHRKEK